MKTILVAINNDEKKDVVLNHAIGLARRYKSDLVIAHVNEIIVAQTGGMTYGGGSPITVESLPKPEIERIERLAKSAGVKNVEVKVVEGMDVSAIITGDLYDSYEPDLIVCGDNKHRSLVEKILGSTASSIVKYAPCSVYIVK